MAKIKGFQGLRAGATANISDDGQAVTISYNDLEVTLDNQNPALEAIQVESFTLNLSENAAEFPIRLVAQGYVVTTPGTRALLVAHMGDTTTLTSFPPTSSDKNSDQSVQQELEAIIPAGVDVQTALFLLVERISGDVSPSAYLNVATLDLSLEL